MGQRGNARLLRALSGKIPLHTRGALDSRATCINEEMKLAGAHAAHESGVARKRRTHLNRYHP